MARATPIEIELGDANVVIGALRADAKTHRRRARSRALTGPDYVDDRAWHRNEAKLRDMLAGSVESQARASGAEKAYAKGRKR